MANLPRARVPAWKERHRRFAVSLGSHILTVLGDIADKEIRMTEHHEVLFVASRLIRQQLLTGYIEQLDGHALASRKLSNCG